MNASQAIALPGGRDLDYALAVRHRVGDQSAFREIYDRFSPMVYFSESPSLDAIRTCVEMGFDDVITLPFTSTRVSSRLDRLVDHTQVYFETADYLGPDRGVRQTRGQRGGQYRRLEIMRTAMSGVSVMRDEMQMAV